jgi:hypothetical protein
VLSDVLDGLWSWLNEIAFPYFESTALESPILAQTTWFPIINTIHIVEPEFKL